MPGTGTQIVPVSLTVHWPNDRLEAEITELAAHIHAATARWLSMVAEFDRRQRWADWDCKSCAHWLMWRCGLSVKAAREHVRVARSLVDLPLISREFEAGRFSYSQVRALTRVAIPDNEADLVEMARHATTAQIEQMVRAFRGAVRAQELDEAKRRQLTRHMTYYYDDDGAFVIKARLAPEEGAVIEKALQAIEADLEKEGASAEASEDELFEDLVDGLNEKAYIDETDSARSAADKEAARQHLYDTFSSTHYSRRSADALVAMADSYLGGNGDARRADDKYQVVVHVDADALAHDALDATCELAHGPSLPPETARRLMCDCSLVFLTEKNGEPLSIGRKSRKIPRRIRRALMARDKGCIFPGCTNMTFVDGHHIAHWTRGGPTALDNLTLLCRFHHRLVHEHGYGVENHEGIFVVVKPDGTRLGPIPMPPVQGGMLPVLQRELDIDHETCVTQWAGERMDHDVAVWELMNAHGLRETRQREPVS